MNLLIIVIFFILMFPLLSLFIMFGLDFFGFAFKPVNKCVTVFNLNDKIMNKKTKTEN